MSLASWIRIVSVLGIFAIAAALGAFGDSGHPAHASTTFTVTTTGNEPDSFPGDGSCKTAISTCTLRAAIQEANTLAGADIVEFALGGPTPFIAVSALELPQITGDLEIRGNTGGATRVILDGAPAGPAARGLRACAPNVSIHHMVVERFTSNGIVAECTGFTLLDNNYIGIDATGTVDSGNAGDGVLVTSTGTTVVSNSVISGNDTHGIATAPPSASPGAAISITNNVIGLTAAANADIGNTGMGVSADGNWNQTMLIAGNIVSGNNFVGVQIGSSMSGAVLSGNRIGLSGTGTALPNGVGGPADIGININGDNTLVDGTNPSWGPNRIAAQAGAQIQTLAAASGTVIKGNFIGTDGTGLVGLGGGVGLNMIGPGSTVGGNVPGERNIISGNGAGGIALGTGGDNNVIRDNLIGVAADGVTGIGNGAGGASAGAGVAFVGGKGNSIWSNIIARNLGDGVRSGTSSSFFNELSANSIHDNVGMGINWIGSIGPDANDVKDFDTGADGLQNYPLIAAAKTNGSFTVVKWSLNSLPGTGFEIQFFQSAACDPSGFGEGEMYLGSIAPPPTDVNGDILSRTDTTGGSAAGNFITATAINVSNDTSEFSACVPIASCGADTDCDTFADVPPILHQQPANTSATVDNCIGSYNPTQLNTADGDVIDLSPDKTYDDITWPNSDAKGDACDLDSDNDGIDDDDELLGTACGGLASDPYKRDTDGDLFLDGAECVLGKKPGDVFDKPATTSCGATTDADNDGFIDRYEFCFYNSDPTKLDTDSDGCPDGVEIATINGDRKVSAIDLSQIAQNFNTSGYALPASPVNADFDVNKDGKISSIDLSKVAQLFFECS